MSNIKLKLTPYTPVQKKEPKSTLPFKKLVFNSELDEVIILDAEDKYVAMYLSEQDADFIVEACNARMLKKSKKR